MGTACGLVYLWVVIFGPTESDYISRFIVETYDTAAECRGVARVTFERELARLQAEGRGRKANTYCLGQGMRP